MARFMTKDPSDGDMLEPMSYNPWLYVYANPINRTDPSGMCEDLNGNGICDVGDSSSSGSSSGALPNFGLPFCFPSVVARGLACIPVPCWGGPGAGWIPGSGGGPGPDPTPQYDFRVEKVNLSAYYTPLESESTGEKVPIKANNELQSITGGDYLLEEDFNGSTKFVQNAQTARSGFLSDSAGLCMQGSGKLENGMFISCRGDPADGFGWKYPDSAAASQHIVALETAARCPTNAITPFRTGDVIEIPAIKSIMDTWGKDEFFTITDVGGGLCKNPAGGHPLDSLDIYVGEGFGAYNTYANVLIDYDDVTVHVYRNP